jgi:ribosomal protein S18 acetylase RimI-like enzyme
MNPTSHTIQPWMHSEIRRIAQKRFSTEYWSSIETVLESYSPQHSRVILSPNKEKSLAAPRVVPGDSRQEQSLDSFTALKHDLSSFSRLAAFVLVCPPHSSSHAKYGLEGMVPNSFYEIAFVATDEGCEGRGYARLLLSSVLQCCTENSHNVWLHVDSINPRAVALYESLGFQTILDIPDPFGSQGYLMVRLDPKGRHSKSRERFALFDTSPCQAEQTFSGCIVAPPSATCC